MHVPRLNEGRMKIKIKRNVINNNSTQGFYENKTFDKKLRTEVSSYRDL